MSQYGDVGRQQASYRRGLVLGLTVAESMLLILFALLLALGYVLLKRDDAARKLAIEITTLQKKAELAEAKVEVLDAIARNKPTDEFFQELVKARELARQVEAERRALEERE